MMRMFEDAAVFLKRGVSRNPDALWPHVYLAACYGHLGDTVEGRAQLTEVERLNPDFSITTSERLLPYKRDADQLLLVAGLRAAGLNE